MKKPSFWASLFQARCPACRQGPIFERFMVMHKSCSACGTVYEREHGFFLMSIFVGYVLNGLLFAPLALFGYFTDNLLLVAVIIGVGIILLFAPTFRYSRIVWLYLDQMLDPRRDSVLPTQEQ